MHPQPLFEIFGRGVYAYGICMAVGIIACFGFLMFAMWYKKFNEDASDKILIVGILSTGLGLLCGFLVQDILNFIKRGTWQSFSGMTFLGGLIGGTAIFLGVWNTYVYVIAPRAKTRLLQNRMNAGLSDALPFIPIGICIAHAVGRLGCFFGGCCYGIEAEWGLYCAGSYSPASGIVTVGPKVIPTQLFEMAFLVVLAVIMAVLYFKFKFNYNFGVYGVAYGIWRFIIEFIRDDDRGAKIFGLFPSQFWGILMVLVGIGYFFLQYYVLSKLMKHPELQKEQQPEPVKVEE